MRFASRCFSLGEILVLNLAPRQCKSRLFLALGGSFLRKSLILSLTSPISMSYFERSSIVYEALLLSFSPEWEDICELEFRQHFLALRHSLVAVRLAGHGGGSDVGERSLSSHRGLACLPQHALRHSLLPWRETRDAHKHTREKRREATGQAPRSGKITEHTVCLRSSRYIVIFLPYLCFYLSRTLLPWLPRFFLPRLSTKRSVACQGCKLLTPPFLVSKQVILFSIPVSAETVIICPLKRSHTLRAQCWKSLPEKLLRLIWQRKLQVTFYNKHRTSSSGSSSSTFLDSSFLLFLQKL